MRLRVALGIACGVVALVALLLATVDRSTRSPALRGSGDLTPEDAEIAPPPAPPELAAELTPPGDPPAASSGAVAATPEALPTAILEVRAIDESGLPVADVRGELRRLTGGNTDLVRSFVTGPDGIAEISLDPGRVYFDLDHDSLASPPRAELEVAPGERTVREVVMPAARTLVGTVRDRDTGLPIVGAMVGVARAPFVVVVDAANAVLTDSRGLYRIDGFDGVGEHYLLAEAEEYVRGSSKLPDVDRGPIDFELFRGDVAVGRVVGPDGSPLAGIRVGTSSSRRPPYWLDGRREVVTGPQGVFRVTALHPERSHLLSILEEGFGRTCIEFDRSLRGPTGVIDLGTISLPHSREILGEFVDAEGAPIAGEEVFITSSVTNGPSFGDEPSLAARCGHDAGTHTDDLGRFGFADLSPGTYRVAAGQDGATATIETVRLDPSGPTSVSVRLVRITRPAFSVEVRFSNGEAVGGIEVMAWRKSVGARGARRTADGEGIARFEGLAGEVQVHAQAPEGWFAPPPLTVVPRGQTERIVLEPAALLRGRIVPPPGTPPEEPLPLLRLVATVHLAPGGTEVRFAGTRPDGEFAIEAPEGSVVDIECRGESIPSALQAGETIVSWVPWTGALRGIAAPARELELVLTVLPTDRTLAVRVSDAEGRALAGVKVRAAAIGAREEIVSAVTDDRGLARLSGLPGMSISLDCEHPEKPPEGGGDAWIPPSRETVVPAGQEVTMTFRPGWRFLGLVADAAGDPIERGEARYETSTGRRSEIIVRHGTFELVLLEGETAAIEVEADRNGRVVSAREAGIRAGEKSREFVLREE